MEKALILPTTEIRTCEYHARHPPTPSAGAVHAPHRNLLIGLVYHRRPLGKTNRNHPVVCIERMHFDEHGHIMPVTITFDGIAPLWPMRMKTTTKRNEHDSDQRGTAK